MWSSGLFFELGETNGKSTTTDFDHFDHLFLCPDCDSVRSAVVDCDCGEFIPVSFDPKETIRQPDIRVVLFRTSGINRWIIPGNSEIEIEGIGEVIGNLGGFIQIQFKARESASLDIDYHAEYRCYSTDNRITFDVNPVDNDYLIRMSVKHNWLKCAHISHMVLRNLSDFAIEITDLRIVNEPL